MEELTAEGKIDEDILTAAAHAHCEGEVRAGCVENPYCDVIAVSFVQRGAHRGQPLRLPKRR